MLVQCSRLLQEENDDVFWLETDWCFAAATTTLVVEIRDSFSNEALGPQATETIL